MSLKSKFKMLLKFAHFIFDATSRCYIITPPDSDANFVFDANTKQSLKSNNILMFLKHEIFLEEGHTLESTHALGKRHPHNTMDYFLESNNTHV